MNASREHAYNKESNQLWQKSSFYLKKDHMENKKWDKSSTNWLLERKLIPTEVVS